MKKVIVYSLSVVFSLILTIGEFISDIIVDAACITLNRK